MIEFSPRTEKLKDIVKRASALYEELRLAALLNSDIKPLEQKAYKLLIAVKKKAAMSIADDWKKQKEKEKTSGSK